MWKLEVWDCRAAGVPRRSAERGEQGPGAGGKQGVVQADLTLRREKNPKPEAAASRGTLRSGVFVLLEARQAGTPGGERWQHSW